MCRENRELFFILFLFLFLSCFLGVLQGEEPAPTSGETPLLSQSSGLKSNSSDETSRTWEILSGRFQTELTGLRYNLMMASQEATTSKTSLEKLTSLYEDSLTRIENLERYARQTAERMQERDEDLAWAYAELDEKDIIIAKKDTTIWKLIVVIIIFGIIIFCVLAFAIIKFILWIKGGAAASLIKKLFGG